MKAEVSQSDSKLKAAIWLLEGLHQRPLALARQIFIAPTV
jgi:hypothetical protein